LNPALLAREAASALGSLDHKPEPAIVFQGPTRLIRVVENGVEVTMPMPRARVSYKPANSRERTVWAVWDGSRWLREAVMKPISGPVTNVDYNTFSDPLTGRKVEDE